MRGERPRPLAFAAAEAASTPRPTACSAPAALARDALRASAPRETIS